MPRSIKRSRGEAHTPQALSYQGLMLMTAIKHHHAQSHITPVWVRIIHTEFIIGNMTKARECVRGRIHAGLGVIPFQSVCEFKRD